MQTGPYSFQQTRPEAQGQTAGVEQHVSTAAKSPHADRSSMIILPVEVASRDLLGRFYLAFECARPGDYIAIGRHDYLWALVKFNPGCIYVGKSVLLQCGGGSDARRIEFARRYGIRNIWLDDEGVATTHDVDAGESYLATRCDPTLFGEESCVAVWGERQRRWHRDRVDPRVAVVVTGNPRFEMSRQRHAPYYAPEVQRIRSTYGQFVLVNTRFGVAFSLRPFAFNFKDGVGPALVTEEQVHAAEFVRAVRSAAAELPETRFVVRPHPAGDVTRYQLLFGDLPNVSVVLEGEVIPWIHASLGVIQNSCTTGIEATLAGKPVIAYLPEHLNGHGLLDHRRAVANLTSMLAQRPSQLADIVRDVTAGRFREDSARRAEAATHIENLQTEGVSTLVSLIDERRNGTASEIRLGRLYGIGRQLTEPLRYVRRELNPARRGETWLGKRDFPPLSAATVSRNAEYFSAITGKRYQIASFNRWHCILHFPRG